VPLARLRRSRTEAEDGAFMTEPHVATQPDAEYVENAIVDLLTAEEKNHRYDLQTAAIIRRVMHDGDLAVDVGAHTGEILRGFVTASPGVRHVAVEPIPELAAGLRDDFPSVDVHEVALVAEPAGPVSFHHVTSNPAYSGILRRRYDRSDEDVSLIEVPTARLDDLVGDRAVRMIKIDVEGAELGVLAGATRTLARDKPVVVFEHGLGGSDFYGTTPEAVFELFSDHAMGVYLLASWLELGPPLSSGQFADQFNEGRNYYFVAAS
jgi:FkbM family methyltransferase